MYNEKLERNLLRIIVAISVMCFMLVNVSAISEGEYVVEKVVYQEKTTNLIAYILCIVFFMAFVGACIKMYFQNRIANENLQFEQRKNESLKNKIAKLKESHLAEANEMMRAINEQSEQIYEINQKLLAAKKEIQTYEDNFEVINILHPNIVIQVEEYYREKQKEASK